MLICGLDVIHDLAGWFYNHIVVILVWLLPAAPCFGRRYLFLLPLLVIISFTKENNQDNSADAACNYTHNHLDFVVVLNEGLSGARVVVATGSVGYRVGSAVVFGAVSVVVAAAVGTVQYSAGHQRNQV